MISAVPTAARPATPPIVPRLLRDYGVATRRLVDTYLDREPRAAYLDPLLREYPQRPGKMMRPSICIATARALGCEVADALPAAASLELFHNALLIHDDVEDESEIRRGKETLHRLHGIPQAVNAGDALMLLALEPLFDSVHRLGSGASRGMLEAVRVAARETAAGQALELGWREHNRLDLSDREYLLMVLKKTAWMSTILPLQLGIIVGGAFGRQCCAPSDTARFGFFLGAVFQIQDDLLNLVADPAYGKEANGDLYEGKRTLMLLHLCRNASPTDRAFVVNFLSLPRHRRTAAMVAQLADMLVAGGAIDYARAVAGALAGAAAHEFDRVFGSLPDNPDKAFLAGLVTWVFERQ